MFWSVLVVGCEVELTWRKGEVCWFLFFFSPPCFCAAESISFLFLTLVKVTWFVMAEKAEDFRDEGADKDMDSVGTGAERKGEVVAISEDELVAKMDRELQELEQLRKVSRRKAERQFYPADIENVIELLKSSSSLVEAKDKLDTFMLKKTLAGMLERESNGHIIKAGRLYDASRLVRRQE